MTKYIDSVRAALNTMAELEAAQQAKRQAEFEEAAARLQAEETVAEKKMMCEKCGKMHENGECDNDDEDEMDEAMDPVDPKAVKKDFKDRKDKDIDNDGDVDASDEYLHKKRKAISKSKGKNEDEPEGEKGETATMNPKKEDKVTKESTIRDRLMSIWEKADQTKNATPAEPATKDDERSAKKMKDGHPIEKRGEIGPEADDTDKAERSGPSPKPRGNDNMIGDRQIINKIANAYKKLGSGKDA